jgi:manganese/iron transport system substrate-binding protein
MIFNFIHSVRYMALLVGILGLLLTGCASNGASHDATEPTGDARLHAVATTTIVADVVRNIAGKHVDLHALIPAGVDEHSFQATPEDVARLADADVVFMNGAGLETFMQPLMKNVAGNTKLVSVSDRIALAQAGSESGQLIQSVETGDPHVWLDPNLVMTWTENIAAVLAELDPANAGEYQANAQRYRQSLTELDGWIQQQVAQVPAGNRLLVTDHEIFTYFAERYGFRQIGALVPSYSTAAEPTAQELAALEDAMRQLGVKAVFVGNTVNPDLARRFATDTSVQLVQIYTGSLSNGTPAGTYLDYMRANVTAIVQALK